MQTSKIINYITCKLQVYSVLLWFLIFVWESKSVMSSESSNTFLYFAYGSNLNSTRIHVNNPTAKRLGAGLLKEYRLDFSRYSDKWKGAVATIVPDKDEEVWGAIWEINQEDMANLDHQEGVHINIYTMFQPIVSTPDNKLLKCRSYHLTEQPSKEVPLPSTRYPSKLYHSTIVEGAKEGKLPSDYIEKLKNIPNNGIIPELGIPKDKVVD